MPGHQLRFVIELNLIGVHIYRSQTSSDVWAYRKCKTRSDVLHWRLRPRNEVILCSSSLARRICLTHKPQTFDESVRVGRIKLSTAVVAVHAVTISNSWLTLHQSRSRVTNYIAIASSISSGTVSCLAD